MDDYTKKALELFGAAIQMAIDERNINISELASKSGVSRNTLYAILRAEKTYSIDSYIKVARALQIHI